MEPSTRALPASDLQAIFGVVALVHGELLAGGLSRDLERRLLDRLTRHGPLAEGASPGELNFLLADLCQRMQWAMSGDGGYPEPTPRRTVYYLEVPTVAADACAADLTGLGGELKPYPGNLADRRRLAVAFPDLPPDPAHQARVAELTALARRHGGEFCGFGF